MKGGHRLRSSHYVMGRSPYVGSMSFRLTRNTERSSCRFHTPVCGPRLRRGDGCAVDNWRHGPALQLAAWVLASACQGLPRHTRGIQG